MLLSALLIAKLDLSWQLEVLTQFEPFHVLLNLDMHLVTTRNSASYFNPGRQKSSWSVGPIYTFFPISLIR